MSLFPAYFLFLGLLIQPFHKLLAGFGKIITEPDLLITDYVALRGPGAALVNAGLFDFDMYFNYLPPENGNYRGDSDLCVFNDGIFFIWGKTSLIYGVYWPVFICIPCIIRSICPNIFTLAFTERAFPR